MSKRESHKQALRDLFRRYGVTLPFRQDSHDFRDEGHDFREPLIDEILHINDRFNSNPSLDEALSSGDGSYKP